MFSFLARLIKYAGWILSIKQTLGLYDHGDEGSRWQIVTGEIPGASGGSEIKTACGNGNETTI